MVTSAFSLDSNLITKTKGHLHFGEADGDSVESYVHIQLYCVVYGIKTATLRKSFVCASY